MVSPKGLLSVLLFKDRIMSHILEFPFIRRLMFKPGLYPTVQCNGCSLSHLQFFCKQHLDGEVHKVSMVTLEICISEPSTTRETVRVSEHIDFFDFL